MSRDGYIFMANNERPNVRPKEIIGSSLLVENIDGRFRYVCVHTVVSESKLTTGIYLQMKAAYVYMPPYMFIFS